MSDIFEALTAKRPYRQDLTDEEVSTIMNKKVGTGICPAVYEALKVYLAEGGYTPMSMAA